MEMEVYRIIRECFELCYYDTKGIRPKGGGAIFFVSEKFECTRRITVLGVGRGGEG